MKSFIWPLTFSLKPPTETTIDYQKLPEDVANIT